MNQTSLDPALIDCSDALIHNRQHVGPKHLVEPGPDDASLRELFRAAAAAPDHAQLRPWRFLVIGNGARERLAHVFATSLTQRDPQARPAQIEDARAKAFRGPTLVMAIADLRADDPDVPDFERVVSLGCGIQNFMLAANARGFACGLTSGRAMNSQAMREAFALEAGEHAICFISVGTPKRSKPIRPRPLVDEFVQWV